MFYEFEASQCLGVKKSSACRLDGFYFDTFNTFKPNFFLVLRPYVPNHKGVVSKKQVLPDVLTDMQGYEFIVATLHYAPFIRMHKDADGNILSYSGIEVALLKYLARRSNFTYRLINPPDGAWGRPDDETGIWSGLMGHAYYGLSNWSMSGIAVNPPVLNKYFVVVHTYKLFTLCHLLQRESVIDFAYHHTAEYFDWVGPIPHENPKWPAIFKPFTPFVWGCVILAARESLDFHSESKDV